MECTVGDLNPYAIVVLLCLVKHRIVTVGADECEEGSRDGYVQSTVMNRISCVRAVHGSSPSLTINKTELTRGVALPPQVTYTLGNVTLAKSSLTLLGLAEGGETLLPECSFIVVRSTTTKPIVLTPGLDAVHHLRSCFALSRHPQSLPPFLGLSHLLVYDP